MKKYKLIVIGGGAAGLFAALSSKYNGSQILIIEHMKKIGKKIAATGNGKCNYSNTSMSEECYHSNSANEIMKIIDLFDTTETIEYFNRLGIYPRIKNGYVYPYSEQAASVVSALEMELKHKGVTIICDKHVNDIKKVNTEFCIKTTDEDRFFCERVIIATGGKAYPKLGSDGSGYELAKMAGHTIIPTLPALVSLRCCNPKKIKEMSGVRVPAKVSLYIDNKMFKFEEGEIIFTDYGVSGIPIMQISRFASNALKASQKVRVNIDLFPSIKENELKDILAIRRRNNSYKDNYKFLIGLVNNKIAGYINNNYKVDDDCKLAHTLKNISLDITDTSGFDMAQVTAGGVSLKQINIRTMESLICPGLYFAGEILDVDGTCGGYNLQWAWTSGYLAGINA